VVNIHKLSNGMILVVESLPEVSSAAFVFFTPAGVVRDPRERTGTAAVLTELVYRGAGQWDSRGISEQLDQLGLHRHTSVSSLHSSFSGALVGDNVLRALEMHADILRRPSLAEDQFELCRELALQSLDSLDDDPRQKISLVVNEKYLGYPYGRPAPGKKEELEQLQYDEIKKHWENCYTPEGAILAVAGKVDFDEIKDKVESYFGDWQGEALNDLPPESCQSVNYHLANEGAQVHIGLMYSSVNYNHPDYYKALAAVSVLSGGMGSRLFTEVREKRGLCYAVGAAHRVIANQGAVGCYLGSTPEKAQEGLDVMIAELEKLTEGITEEELGRAKVGLRASLVMQGESTGARASNCAADYFYRGRVRSLEEIEQAVLALTVEDVVEHVRQFRPGNFTVATIGPKELIVRSLETMQS